MLLRSLQVRHFRGLASAEVALEDPATLWIGENDCGKSSLLEALALALGAGAPEAPIVFGPPHLHHAGPTQDSEVAALPAIELVFEERRAGEVPGSSPLAGLLGKASTAPRSLRLSIEARRRDGDLVTSFTLAGAKGPPAVDDTALLAELRRLHPLLWIHGGMLVGGDLLSSASAEQAGELRAALAPEVAALVKELEARYARVVAGESLHTAHDIALGAEAAEALLQLRSEGERGTLLGSGGLVAEIVGPRSQPSSVVERKRSRLGSAAQRIGLLMLVAALTRSGRAAFAKDADPIVIVEDPEAHLHPMTLATVWDLLAQIRWQKIVTTQSGTLLAAAPLSSLRRLVRNQTDVYTYAVRAQDIGRDALRKFSYHVRFRRGTAMFARAWLLVEGETEFWLVSECARLMGFDLPQEGVAVVEFAQAGLAPLIKVADALGIAWHVLTDGDRAGDSYAEKARTLARPRPAQAHLSKLPEADIEHCFYAHGYAQVFARHAKLGATAQTLSASRVIRQAIEHDSKPGIAFALIEAASAARAPGIPRPLRQTIEQVLKLAWAPPVPPRTRAGERVRAGAEQAGARVVRGVGSARRPARR